MRGEGWVGGREEGGKFSGREEVENIYIYGRMGFLFIRKTASTGSSATGALVAAGSLQPLRRATSLLQTSPQFEV